MVTTGIDKNRAGEEIRTALDRILHGGSVASAYAINSLHVTGTIPCGAALQSWAV
jgi:hypothetical protein